MSASSGSHPRSRLNVLQKKQARLAQRHCRWMAHLGPSVRSRDPLATADGGERALSCVQLPVEQHRQVVVEGRDPESSAVGANEIAPSPENSAPQI
jgi:hypothetical protein